MDDEDYENEFAANGGGGGEEFAGIIEGWDERKTADVAAADWHFHATEPRAHVDLGVAGSLRQELTRARAETARPRWQLIALGASITAAGLIAAVLLRTQLPWWLSLCAGIVVATLTVITVHRGLGPRIATLTRQITQEQRVAKILRAHLVGTGWAILPDRVLGDTEQRLAFIAVGPGGVVYLPPIPEGPYGVSGGVFTVRGTPIEEWLQWRQAEYRNLSTMLINHPHRDLTFTGPIWMRYLYIHPQPSGHPVPASSIDGIASRDASHTAETLLTLPRTHPTPAQTRALIDLVATACPPAGHPTP